MKNEIWVSWWSAGVTSAVATKIALDTWGDKVEPYYIEIESAHPDNERFIADCERWYGKKINRLKSPTYKDQFDVIEKTGYVNGPSGARCTLELKKNVRFAFEESRKGNLFEPSKPIIQHYIMGFEFSPKEINRALGFRMDFPYPYPLFPLIEKKLTKENCHALLNLAGIEEPAMYRLGYNNNNCIGCVKGGQGYWNKIRVDFPEHFNRMAKAERVAGHSCINGIFLDELNPTSGRDVKPIIPDCGMICQTFAEDFASAKAERIYNGLEKF